MRHDEVPLLEAVLDVADSAMTYRRRYLATLQVAPVVDLLAADEGNPRSVMFQLDRAGRARRGAAARRDRGAPQPEERLAVEALSAFRLVDVDVLCAEQGGARPALRELLRGLVANLRRCPTRCRAATWRPPPSRARWPRRGW